MIEETTDDDEALLGHLMLVATKVAKQLSLTTAIASWSTMVDSERRASTTCTYTFSAGVRCSGRSADRRLASCWLATAPKREGWMESTGETVTCIRLGPAPLIDL